MNVKGLLESITSVNPMRFRFCIVAFIVFVGGLYLAFSSEQKVELENKIQLIDSISTQLNLISTEIKTGFGKYENALQGLRATINSVKLDNFTYQHHLDYSLSRHYQQEFPGSRGFGVIKKVEKENVLDFLKYARQDRNGEFELKQLNDPQDSLFIIQYIEPEVNNKQAVGLDIGSEKNRRQAAIKAAISNTVQLTGPITLVQANNKQSHGFLFLLPIYDSSNLQVDENSNVNAWVYAPLLINEILDGVTDLHTHFKISISDSYLKQQTTFYNSEIAAQVDTSIQLSNTIEIYGRKWTISLSPTFDYIKSLALESPQAVRNQIILLFAALSLMILLIGNVITKRLDALTRKLSYAAVVKNTKESIIAVDKDFLILHWNDSAQKLFGRAVNDAAHKRDPLLSWLKPYIAQDKLIAFFKQVSRGESILNNSFVYKNESTGDTKQLQISFIPLMQNGEFLGATISIIDITKLIQLQSDLENKNEFLEQQVAEKSGEIVREALFQTSVLNSSRTAIIATDLDGVITLINQSGLDLLKLKEAEVINKVKITELIQATFFENNESVEFSSWVAKRLERQSSAIVTFSTDLLELDIPVNLTSSKIVDEHGSSTGYVFLAEDIRETLSLKRHVSLINSAIDNSQDVLLWLDSEGDILHLNNYANAKLGHGSNLIEDKTINEIILFNDNESWETIKQHIHDNTRISLERFYQQENGDLIPMLISCCHILIDNESVYFLAAKNIASRLEEENKLKTALSNVDAASKSKTTFISKMSHELRTPLNIANGMLQILELSVLTDVQRTSVDGAKQSMKHLTYIIDDIMDLSDADRGLLKLNCSEFVLDDVLNDIGFNLSNLIGDKPVEVHFSMTPEVPVVLYGDVKKLRQIILNITSNAVKFTLSGEVVINIDVERTDSNDLTLLFSISDTGIGIDEKQLSKIFQLFSQSDDSSSRHYGGLGVGLTIAHQFVQLMDGDLTVVSEKGVGSTFNFNVSLVEVDSESTLISDTLKKPLNVLLVDDNHTALNVLGSTIKLLGWQVCIASNAEDGFKLFEQALNNKKSFDLVLLDWKMPEVDGWQLAEKIRGITTAEYVPLVIMVAASSRQKLAEKAACTKSVLNGFIIKPVTRSMLIDAISDALSVSEQNSLGNLNDNNNAEEGKPLTNKRILVVEDNPTNQLIAKTLLTSQGAEVVVAEGGLLALAELDKNTFDFILMDIQMPDLDGYETTRRIRANEKYLSLPIYAMTANVSDTDKELCYQAGMDGHIGKPFQLQHVVEQILNATSGENTLKNASIAEQKLQDCISKDVIEYCADKNIDIETSLARFNYLIDLYKRSLELFMDDLKVDLVTLSSLHPTSLNPTLLSKDQHLLFHTMKSSSASLGFNQLNLVAKEIEQQITDNVFEQDKSLSDSKCKLVTSLMKQAVEDIQGLLNKLIIDEPQTIIVDAVDLHKGFAVLYTDVIEFNMNAFDSYQNISVSLNSLSRPICDKLVQSLNKLQFTEAKVHLDALKQLLMEE